MDDRPPTLGAVLLEARKKKNISQTKVGNVAGVTRQAVGQWERNENSPEYHNLVKVAAYLGIEPGAALEGRLILKQNSPERPHHETKNEVVFPATEQLISVTPQAQDVPILGVAQGGARGGDFYMNGEVVDYARRVPALRGTRNAYAIYYTGDSMWPRYDRSDLLYVNPDRPPAIGDDVLIELVAPVGEKNGAAYIKTLVRRTSTEYVCQQYNPSKEVRFRVDQVKNIHRILSRNEVAGG